MNKFNLLNTQQFGFLAGQNTSVTLKEILDRTYVSIDQNRVLLKIFLRFSKAFDKVDHENILRRLYYYGFRGNSIDWF